VSALRSEPRAPLEPADAAGVIPAHLTFPALLWGLLLTGAGFGIYTLGALTRFLSLPFDRHDLLLPTLQRMVWYSGILVVTGLIFVAIDLLVLLPWKRRGVDVHYAPVANPDVTVVLTAYNDEASIGHAVKDFVAHPRTRRVIVVDNASKDRTAAVAEAEGAVVVREAQPGYGRCVWRALAEGYACGDTDFTLLCEGDMTYRAYDIDKFLAYAPHADIVNGTRIVEQLRSFQTQLTTGVYYGNFVVGKLLELKHIGQGTFTDVGTTYKLCRNETLASLLPLLDSSINFEFNAHFLDVALGHRFRIVECPVTFHARYGRSKGASSNWVAARIGLRMIFGMLFGWKHLRRP
jgi:hypothetical protein